MSEQVKCALILQTLPVQAGSVSQVQAMGPVDQHLAKLNPDPPAEGASKHDSDKPRMALLPPAPLVEIAQVLTFGARKYAAHNWNKGISFERLYSAMQRHMMAWWSGEETDPESGLSHLAHAGCCLLFIMELRHTKPDCDDRPGILARPLRASE